MENNNYRGNSGYSDNDSRANNRGSRPYNKQNNYQGNGGYNKGRNFGNRRNFNNNGGNSEGGYQSGNNYRGSYNSDGSDNGGYRSNYNSRSSYGSDRSYNSDGNSRSSYSTDNQGRSTFTNNQSGRQHFRRTDRSASQGGYSKGSGSYGSKGGNSYGNNRGGYGNSNSGYGNKGGNNNYRRYNNENNGDSHDIYQNKRAHYGKPGSHLSVDNKGFHHKRYWDHSDRKEQAFQQAVESEDDFLHNDGKIRLNKYLANSGMCSRREADRMIKAGMVQVNGEVVTEMGVKVNISDEVKYNDMVVKPERKRYLLLNKPKDYITTLKDPHARNTVMELIEGACKERVYPVGRLDRNTTGVLLFTNDGDLAKKLTHPSNEVQKIYHVTLDKSVSAADMEKIAQGFDLEDGFIAADEVSYVEDNKGDINKSEVGIRIHSGRNRIVRRIFESLGYDVKKLDRVMFAGLDKKGLGRGRWRFLSDREIGFLNMISTQKPEDIANAPELDEDTDFEE